jgi:predicted Zn-dependent peptidase
MINVTKIIAKALCIAAISQMLASAPGVKLPPYKKTTLKNGMTVVLMEQRKVPLVDIQLTFKSGTTSDPEGKEGLADITNDLLRKGTKKYNSLQISEALDSRGATFNTYADLDSTYCTAQFMAKDIAGGLDLFAEILTQPAFPEDEFNKLRAQNIDALRSAKDRAGSVLRRYYCSFFYGDHPYARPVGGDENSLAAITRGDVLKHYASNYSPANAVLIIVGDFKTADMEKMVSQKFGSWKQDAPKAVDLPKPASVKGQKLLLVDKPDATQTYFAIGNIGVERTNPDRVAIEVVNTLFGGRFTSMINTALRIKSGLTYGANSGFPMAKAAGPFVIVSFTANATTEKALELTLETLKELHEKGFTEEDLASAKAYIKGTYPPRALETGAQLASRLSDLQLYGLPDSDVNDYYAKVDAVTLDEASRAIKNYFPKDDLCFVLIGKAAEIRPAAEKFAGEIKEKSISEPGF